MARDETPPWGRGATQYNGNTIDLGNLGGTNYCGKEWRFEDVTYNTNMYVTVRAVRNTGTFNLLPSRIVAMDSAYPLNAINGYASVTNAFGVVLDEFLPSTGLVPNDVGFIVMEGPTLVLAPLDGGADNVINFMDPLVALTAATSGATTAGRVATGGTSGQLAGVLNMVGRALSAKTTGNTGALVLIDVKRLF